MVRSITLLLFVFTACSKDYGPAPEGVPSWQWALLNTSNVSAGWGYYDYATKQYVKMGSARSLGSEQRATLKKIFETPSGKGPFKCIIHIDGALEIDGAVAQYCSGCGILVVGADQYSVPDNEALKALFIAELGERPAEPRRPPPY